MQIISKDENMRSNTVQDLTDFNSQAKEGDQLVSMMPAIKKAFDSKGDDILEISTENESLKKICSHDEKWLEESKSELLKQINDEKRANSITSRKQKRMKKNNSKWHI